MNRWQLDSLRQIFKILPLARGKQTFANEIYRRFRTQGDQFRVVKSGGAQFKLDLKDRIQAIFFLTNLYEPATFNTCLSLLESEEKSVYFDVGANVGLLALRLKAKRPKAECHLFEPDPTVFAQLKTNASLNHFNSIFLNQNAVSNRHDETLTFHPSTSDSESGWGRLQNNENRHKSSSVTVTSVSLDEYIKNNKIERVNLLKIDVEGAEESVLLGAEATLREKKINHIICELNEEALQEFGTSSQNLISRLKNHGYASVAQFEMNMLFSLKR